MPPDRRPCRARHTQAIHLAGHPVVEGAAVGTQLAPNSVGSACAIRRKSSTHFLGQLLVADLVAQHHFWSVFSRSLSSVAPCCWTRCWAKPRGSVAGSGGGGCCGIACGCVGGGAVARRAASSNWRCSSCAWSRPRPHGLSNPGASSLLVLVGAARDDRLAIDRFGGIGVLLRLQLGAVGPWPQAWTLRRCLRLRHGACLRLRSGCRAPLR